jgi:hypothetical protein
MPSGDFQNLPITPPYVTIVDWIISDRNSTYSTAEEPSNVAKLRNMTFLMFILSALLKHDRPGNLRELAVFEEIGIT